MPRRVDRANLLEAEVPLGVGIEERPDEGTAGAVDVERDVEALLVANPTSNSLIPTTSSA